MTGINARWTGNLVVVNDLNDLVSQTYYADDTAIEAVYPAASNSGALALVGTGPSDAVTYYSDGVSWAEVSSGGGITDLTTWDSRPNGSADGEYGIGPNGVIYRWKAAISRWVPAGLFGYTFTQRGATLGDSASPSGWSNDLGSGTNISTNGTVMTIDTFSSPAAQERIELITPPGPGDIVWISGYYWVTQASSGSGVGASGSIFHDDGSKRRLVGPDGTSERLRFNNSLGTSLVGAGGNTSQNTRAWFEYVAIPGSDAVIYLNHGPLPGAMVSYSQNSGAGGTGLKVGDSSTTSGSTSKFEDFRVYSLT